MFDERDAEELTAKLGIAVRTLLNQYGTRTQGEVEVAFERRWDRHYGTLTIKADIA